MRRPAVIAVSAVVLVLVLVSALVAGALLAVRPGTAPSSSAAAPASSWPAPARIAWGRCDDGDLRSGGAQCATVRVPLDWSAPTDGRTIGIAISRVRHTATPYEGVILANPGGPGGSGLRLATLGASVPGGVGDRYDWIGFDPRGVGSSTPRLSCDADYANGPRPAYDPATATIVRQWRQRSEAYATACGRRGGDLLAHLTTRDSANDMEYLRIALAADRISFYGYSYGTYLGQVYATLFPSRLKRMVIDSNVNPSEVWYRANLSQDVAFQGALEAWFDWLARYDSRYGLGSTRAAVTAAYERLHQRLAATPADGVYGSAELADTLLYAGYGQRLWPGLGVAFSRALNDDDTAVAQQYWRALNETGDDNGYAMYLAVQCTDAAWPTDWATWERDTRQVDREAPFGTWLNTWFNAPCRTWPAKAGTPVTVDGTKAPPILLVGETLDAATPFSGSLAVRKLFPKARLLAEPGGTSHAESLSGNACVDDTVARYLDDGTLPVRKSGSGPDATCAPTPQPTP